MDTYINYCILPKKKLTIEYFSGTLNAERYFAHKHMLMKDGTYNPEFNMIVDFRDADFEISDDDVMKYIQLIRDNKKLRGDRSVAIITASPLQVVKTTLFQINLQEIPIRSRIVSTLEAATFWLGYTDSDMNEIAYELEKFRQSAEVSVPS